jgi:hypothetical protein
MNPSADSVAPRPRGALDKEWNMTKRPSASPAPSRTSTKDQPPSPAPERDKEAIPKGTPTSDRHGMETAFTDESDIPPGHE